MQVYDITVLFSRNRQPKEYENCRAEITLKAQLDDGESYDEALSEMLDTAAKHVYNRLGMQAQGSAALPAAPAPAPAPAPAANEQTNDLPDETPAEAPKKTAAKSTKSAAKKSTAKAPTKAESDLPDETPAPAPAKTEASQPANDLPEEAPAAAPADDTPTHSEVQKLIATGVQNKHFTVTQAKEVLKRHGAERTQDLPAEKLGQVKSEIESLTL